jgi:alkanesulfonate monooxygenase SsuD/methylene tetrahydromethanopterin reductase-like flavin-dependent oxidoreductase (luciferase family)
VPKRPPHIVYSYLTGCALHVFPRKRQDPPGVAQSASGRLVAERGGGWMTFDCSGPKGVVNQSRAAEAANSIYFLFLLCQ